jgi:hypothetical protein
VLLDVGHVRDFTLVHVHVNLFSSSRSDIQRS